jgi:hypothetical protein
LNKCRSVFSISVSTLCWSVSRRNARSACFKVLQVCISIGVDESQVCQLSVSMRCRSALSVVNELQVHSLSVSTNCRSVFSLSCRAEGLFPLCLEQVQVGCLYLCFNDVLVGFSKKCKVGCLSVSKHCKSVFLSGSTNRRSAYSLSR